MSIILRQNIILLNLSFPLFCEILSLNPVFVKKYKIVGAAVGAERLMSLSESHYLRKHWNYSQLFLRKSSFEKKFLQQPKFYSSLVILKKTTNSPNSHFNQTKRRFLFFNITKIVTQPKLQSMGLTMKSYFSAYSLFDVISTDLKKIFICEEIVSRETVPTFHELSQRDALTQLSDNLQFLIKKIINQKHFLLCSLLHNYCKSAPTVTPLITFALLTIFSGYRRPAQPNVVFVKNQTEIGSILLVSNIRLLSFYNCFLFNTLYV